MTNTLPLCNYLVHNHHVRFYSIYSHSWWDYQIGGFWGFCYPHCGRPVQLVLRLWPVLTLSTPRALYIWSRTWKMDEITKSFRNNILFEFHFIASVHPPSSATTRPKEHEYSSATKSTGERRVRCVLPSIRLVPTTIKIPYFLTFSFIGETITFCINLLINGYGQSGRVISWL